MIRSNFIPLNAFVFYFNKCLIVLNASCSIRSHKNFENFSNANYSKIYFTDMYLMYIDIKKTSGLNYLVLKNLELIF